MLTGRFVSIAVAGFFFTVATAQAAFDSADAPQEKSLKIIRITPAGDDAPSGKQIVIQFNRPVVPVGKMERNAADIPIIMTPALPCEWRWINNSALACNLPDKQPLLEATLYSLEIKPGIKAEDGATLSETYNHQFTTERPAVRWKEFQQWKSAGYPIIRLTFNQPVEKESVAEHIYLAVGENGETRDGVTVSSDPKDSEEPYIIPLPGEGGLAMVNPSSPRKSDDDLRQKNGKEARRVWLVEPKRELPLDSKVILKSEPGLISAIGTEPGIEQSDVVEFHTYPAFAFLGVQCTTNDEKQLIIKPGEKQAELCNPMRSVLLSFSAPVDRESMGSMIKFTPPIGGWIREVEEEHGEYEEEPEIGYQYRQAHTKDKTYEIWLPAGLKAAQDYLAQSRSQSMNWFERAWHWIKSLFTTTSPIEVQDIFGRELTAPVHMAFATGHRTPNFVLDYSHAVLEKNVDSEVPLYVNNLKGYSFDYRRLTPAGSTADLSYDKQVPQVQDIQFAVPLGVREMLEGKSGVVYGHLNTDPSIVNRWYPDLFAQVTPFQVHLKLGHFSSMAWVTDMATGQPVQGTSISLYQDAMVQLDSIKQPDAVTTNAEGIAVLPGTNTLDPDLTITSRYRDDEIRYMLRVDKGDDMALLPIGYDYMVHSYYAGEGEWFYPYNRPRYGHMQAWGTTAQGIYRAGDTMQYKIYVRNKDNESFVPPPSKSYHLEIVDPMGKVVHEVKDIELSAFGGVSGEFAIPKEASVGWYQFQLTGNFAEPGKENNPEDKSDSATQKSWYPMRVLVSDFTPSPFRVSNELNGDLFRSGETITVDTHAALHSGGAYTDASARITAILDSETFTSKHPVAKSFQFDSYQNEVTEQQLYQKQDQVNDRGELSLTFSTGTPKIVYGKLMVESAVADDRGKFITSQARADYIGVDRLVGLRNTQWLYETGKEAVVEYLVVDEAGNPVGGTSVDIAIEQQVTKAARVKGSGNAYLTEYHTEWTPAGNCKGTSAEAQQECRFTPQKAGNYRAIAKIKDSKGNEHATTVTGYALGTEYVSWHGEDDSNLSIVPESSEYKVGDTARYLVKNPYPGAKALISIERYGVLDHFVLTFESSTPVIEFPVKPDYIPGFYLSVTIVSPRVEKPLGEGNVDLGKPSYRMGYVKVPVMDPYKDMMITAKTDREVYKPRDQVTLNLHAEPRMKDKQEPIELAVAVLDESVFDLVAGGKSYFDPYRGFYIFDDLDIRNYSLLTRLIGRQKFEKKGANPGGDGGADLGMRSLFKFVSYWNAALPVDEKGNASVTFEAPDNLTGWRVLAIATTPSDRFGLGDANFKVNRPTEIRPVMPNQVMEGDQFNAGFSVMNRTDKPRTLEVSIQAEGNLDMAKHPGSLKQTIELEPYKRKTVFMPVTSASLPQTADVTEGKLHFTVTAGDASDEDGIVHDLVIHKRRSLEVAATYGTTTEDSIDESVEFPKEMLPDVGNVSVVASPTVIGNLSGAFGYMRDYPYLCWEQRLSKGVMAAHYKNLKPYLPDDLIWKDSDGLPQAMLDQAVSFQAPNGGMTYFVAQDGYVDPYLSAYTALAFNWLRAGGYQVPDQVEGKLHSYLSNLLKQNAVPDFYSEGMTATVRAVALAALAERGRADRADLERYYPFVNKMSLFGKAHFLKAALAVEGGEEYAPEVANMILAASNQTGGKFHFNETLDDSYTRILASPLRENCAILDVFTTYGEKETGKKLVGDIPFKLVRAITQDRGNRDHWENTQENMFCMNALIQFARVYEKDAPDMDVSASMDGEPFGTAAFKDVRDPAATLVRPVRAADPGRKAAVHIEREGSGRLYYATRLAYALPVEMTKPAHAGIEIHREYSVERNGKWELLASPAEVKRGELVRVDLYLSVPAARNFVVVDDPVPGGLEPVNRDLATASVVDADKADFQAAGGAYWFKFSDWVHYGITRWSFYHQELRHNAARFYSDYLPAGNYHLSYTAQAIATGSFSALPTMAQEMYDPDVYGKTEASTLSVSEPQADNPAAP